MPVRLLLLPLFILAGNARAQHLEVPVDSSASPAVSLPVFPKYEEVVRYFYQQYRGNNAPNFQLAKHPDGYHITRLNDYNKPMFEQELIWTPENGWQDVINFNRPDPFDPDAAGRVAEPYTPYMGKEHANRHLLRNAFLQQECDRQPYFGYPGFYHDVIQLLEPHAEALNNDQLHILARCYSYAAAGMLHNNSGFADSTRMFSLPAGSNALNAKQLSEYKAAHTKAVDAYARLMARDPDYPTPIGTVATKYANEVMDGYLTLLYFQHEKEALTVLREGLYDQYLLQSARNFLESCPQDAVLITWGDSDTYPLLYVQITEKVRPDVIVANFGLLSLARYYRHLVEGARSGARPLQTAIRDFSGEIHYLENKGGAGGEPGDALAFLGGFPRAELTSLFIPEAPQKAAFPGREPVRVIWKPAGQYVTFNHLAILDMVAANGWSRPLCFAKTCSAPAYAPWEGYLALEGMVYRLFPNKMPEVRRGHYAISEDRSLELWQKNFRFLADEKSLRPESVPFFNAQLLAGIDLAKALEKAGRCQESLELASTLEASFTDAMHSRGYIWVDLARGCAACGQRELAEHIGLQVWDNFVKEKVDAHELPGREKTKWDLKRIGEQYGIEKLKDLK